MSNKYEIISNPVGTIYNISIWDNIENYGDYDKLFEKLDGVSENDIVILSVSTPGGRCDVGFTIIDRLQKLSCPIRVEVPYPTYSMGAIMALCGDALEIKPGAFLMFHDYSTGSRGKGNEIFKHVEAYKDTFEYKFNEICQPFLSKKECKSILSGSDLYIKWDDDTIEKRIGRHFK